MNLIDEINVKQYNDKYEKGKYICSNCHEITTFFHYHKYKKLVNCVKIMKKKG